MLAMVELGPVVELNYQVFNLMAARTAKETQTRNNLLLLSVITRKLSKIRKSTPRKYPHHIPNTHAHCNLFFT